ncbi:hypothetical protein R1flu_009764 [Riccia fluitans]|uniref:Uncharacterized protein n=1 Tax=Riccia fluitans TaxID=41844 RepID=A0ABD1Z322_9MARC
MEVDSTSNGGRDFMELESPNAAAERSRSDSSAALAQKLLQGWTMLNEHCPQCITPLLRNRQRRVYCVSCKQWVLTEGEAAAKAVQQGVDKWDSAEQAVTTINAPQSLSTTSTTTNGSQTPSSPGNRADVKNNAVILSRISITNLRPDDEEVPDERNPKRLASADPTGDSVARPVTVVSPASAAHVKPASPQSRPGLGLVLQPGGNPVSDVLVYRRTLTTLNEKLEGIRHNISLSQDVNQLSQLFAILQECIQAIEVTRKLLKCSE